MEQNSLSVQVSLAPYEIMADWRQNLTLRAFAFSNEAKALTHALWHCKIFFFNHFDILEDGTHYEQTYQSIFFSGRAELLDWYASLLYIYIIYDLVTSEMPINESGFVKEYIVPLDTGPIIILCCCSVTQLCPTLCNPMECSMSGLPVPHHFLKFAQVHMHYIGDCYPAISFADTLFSFCLQGTFPVSQLFASDDQTTGVSASASVLPRSVQGWFPSRLTGLISLLSKGLSGVFSSTTVWRHQFFSVLPSLFMVQISQPWVPTGKTIALTVWTFIGGVISLFQHTL